MISMYKKDVIDLTFDKEDIDEAIKLLEAMGLTKNMRQVHYQPSGLEVGECVLPIQNIQDRSDNADDYGKEYESTTNNQNDELPLDDELCITMGEENMLVSARTRKINGKSYPSPTCDEMKNWLFMNGYSDEMDKLFAKSSSKTWRNNLAELCIKVARAPRSSANET